MAKWLSLTIPGRYGHVVAIFAVWLIVNFSCKSLETSARKMDPTTEELAKIQDIHGVFEWLELAPDIAEALTAAVGAGPTLRPWARVPAERFAKVVAALTVGERPLTPAEEGQAGEVARIARLALAGPTPATGTTFLATQGAASSQGAALQVLPLESIMDPSGKPSDPRLAGHGAPKVKLASVIDQADDSEIRPMTMEAVRALIAAWKRTANDGEDPAEADEATCEQLSALDFRLKGGAPPYVDFAVWRPFGASVTRLLKFKAYVPLPGGEFQVRELAGPPSHDDWLRSWRVFAFAMEVLGAAGRVRLKRYEDQIGRLAADYPSAWWIVACADIKMRQSGIEKVRRRLETEHHELSTAGLKSPLDPARPWDLCFREAASDSAFWAREVGEKILQYSTAQRSKDQLLQPGCGSLAFAGPAQKRNRSPARADLDDAGTGEPKKKPRKRPRKELREAWWVEGPSGAAGSGAPPRASRKAKWEQDGQAERPDKSRDGSRFLRSGGREVCWAWNRGKGACSEPCPNKRLHRCERCLGKHRGCEHKPEDSMQ